MNVVLVVLREFFVSNISLMEKKEMQKHLNNPKDKSLRR